MGKSRYVLLALAIMAGGSGYLYAIPPPQFRAWGTVGPEAPLLPEGWTEAREPASALTEARLTAEERRRGFVISALDTSTTVSQRAVPPVSDRIAEVGLSAARDEYESTGFVLHAIHPLEDVRVDVSGPRSAAGRAIPADYVDVRFVSTVRVLVDPKAKTFRRQPFLLEKRQTVSVPQDTALRVWLTVKIPAGAEAEDYAGTISVKVAGQELARLPLTVKVLPFTLPPAPIEMAMCYPKPPDSDEMLLKQLLDLREHGCNGIEPAMSVVIKSRDRDYGEDDVAATRAECKRLMDAEKKVFGPRRFPVTFELGHQIAYYWDHGKNWFSFWPHSKKIDQDMLRAVDVIRQMAKAEGWPPLRAYALDEAGAHNLLDEAAYYYGLLKKKRPDLMTWTDIGGGMAMGMDELSPLSASIDMFSTNRFTPEIARALVVRRKPYGIYNGCGATPAGARFFFGFYGYKTGAAQITQWAYHFGNTVFQGGGWRRDDDGYVYLADDGPLPSIMWEAVRAGIDDYRYVSLLAQTIARARRSSDRDAEMAANDADRALTELLGKIGWGFQALSSADRTPPPNPSTLRKWRWQIAQQILKLQPLVAAAATGESAPVRASPLELPWAEPAREELKYGRQLLPRSGFQETMKPWRIEVWNGKGSGRLDDTVRHSGHRSVRIDISAASGNQAVTVLVWHGGGDDGLKLTLKEGRRYELSGWVKWQGRMTPPTLRMALPQGAAKRTQDGIEKPTATGWCRIWTRSEVSFATIPKYLAVWVQGPGTVWISDLSLREAMPTSSNTSPDQKGSGK